MPRAAGGMRVLSFPLGVDGDWTGVPPLQALEAEEELGLPEAQEASSRSQVHKHGSHALLMHGSSTPSL